MTIAMSREQWLASRRKGIGGSDIAALLGLTQYKTPYQLWLEKTARETSDETSEPAYWGNRLEDIVADEFSRRSGLKVQRVNQILVGQEDWMLGNIDRAVINPDIAKRVYLKDGRITTNQILECKTASGWLQKLWGDNAESIPDYYLTQCQWYMGNTQTEICHAAVLIGGQQFRRYQIKFDPELFGLLVTEARRFWFEHVKADIPPEPTTIGDCLHLWAKQDPASILEASPELVELVASYKDLKADIDAAGDELEQIKIQIMQHVKEAETVVHNGSKLLTFKAQESTRLDSKALKAAHPDLFQQFAKTSATRVLRLV